MIQFSQRQHVKVAEVKAGERGGLDLYSSSLKHLQIEQPPNKCKIKIKRPEMKH